MMIINTKSYEVPLRYVELPTERIFNWLDPFNVTAKWACKSITGDWWSPKNVEIRRFFADAWTVEFDKITGHFTDLEESIKNEGILTPISTMSGPPRGTYLKPHHYPSEQQSDLSDAIYTDPFGGSRLTIALKLGIEKIPCIVHDFANLFPDAPEVNDINYHTWFSEEYYWTSAAPYIRLRSHSHIKNQTYIAMNEPTRKAQQRAAGIARERTYTKFGLMELTS